MIGFDKELIQGKLANIEQVKVVAQQPTEMQQRPQFTDSRTLDIAKIELPIVDLDLILKDYDWQVSRDAEALEARLTSELLALEAANVHDIIQSEARANKIIDQIDHVLQELNSIESWIAKYTNLMKAMGKDVHSIEAQNKMMQTGVSNQQKLLSETETLLSNLRVPAYILDVLKNESLDYVDGVRECENAIEKVMTVLRYNFGEIKSLTVVKEQLKLLQGYSNEFAGRFNRKLLEFFGQEASVYLNDKIRISQRNSLKLYAHEQMENKLFKYMNLTSWLKETDSRGHYELQMAYVQEMGSVYAHEIFDFIDILKTQQSKRPLEELDFRCQF
jgi:hypothetical protein